MRLRTRWQVILGLAAFAIVFVPLNSYWQNIETTYAIVLEQDSALCGGPNIPYGVDEQQYLSRYAIRAHGFPFAIQLGGTCVPEASTRMELLDGAIAAVVAIAVAAVTMLIVRKLLPHKMRQQHV